MPCLVGQSLEGVLKVLSFRVLIRGNVAGVAWLSKRWSRTHVMIFMITKLQTRALANAVSCSCSVPTQVQDMTLILDEDPHTCMMWMAWLLAHMPRLRYLKLTIWDHQLSWVPPLMQLQHLELEYDTSTDASMAELLLLTNLRTLSLCENYGLDVLDLRMLPKLQCARLYVSCKKLWVAEQCRVYLELSEVNFTNSYDWSDALASVRSVAWTTEGTRIGQQLPALLMQAHNLSWVDLVCGDVGLADAPVVLVGTLSRLARLNIRANTIHMQLPASLALDRLVIDAQHELYLSCNHVGAFLDGVSGFSINFKTAAGSFMMELCMEMVIRGMAVNIMPLTNDQTRLCHNISTAQVYDFFGCPCGSCNTCLKRAGPVHG